MQIVTPPQGPPFGAAAAPLARHPATDALAHAVSHLTRPVTNSWSLA